MSPLSRFYISVVLTMAMWWPTMMSGIHGETGLDRAAGVFLACFIGSRFALRHLGRLVERYRGPSSNPQINNYTTDGDSVNASDRSRRRPAR